MTPLHLRSRLRSLALILCGLDPDALDALRRERDDARAALNRHSLHLDDIRCDLADAGIAIPEDDDPETTPRRMVRDLLDYLDTMRDREKQLADVIVRSGHTLHCALRQAWGDGECECAPAGRPVPPDRRAAILRAVGVLADLGPNPTAAAVAAEMAKTWQYPAATLVRWVSDVCAEGYLSHDGKRPRGYALTEMGRGEVARA